MLIGRSLIPSDSLHAISCYLASYLSCILSHPISLLHPTLGHPSRVFGELDGAVRVGGAAGGARGVGLALHTRTQGMSAPKVLSPKPLLRSHPHSRPVRSSSTILLLATTSPLHPTARQRSETTTTMPGGRGRGEMMQRGNRATHNKHTSHSSHTCRHASHPSASASRICMQRISQRISCLGDTGLVLLPPLPSLPPSLSASLSLSLSLSLASASVSPFVCVCVYVCLCVCARAYVTGGCRSSLIFVAA